MIDIITVVFQQELYYLEIQARSIEQYIDSDKIGKIFVVVNDESSVCNLVDKNWWGENQSKVEILHRNYFGDASFLNGWDSQQYYKLAAGSISQCEWSMVLDSKTWFIQNLEFHKLFAEDGRIKLNYFPVMEVFYPAKNFVENFFNIKCENIVGPGGVPFFFKTKELILLNDFLTKQNTNLFDFFTKNVPWPTHLTEFILYSGWLMYRHGSLDTLYYSRKQEYIITNIADFEKYEFDNIFPRMQQDNSLTASIHRSVYPALTSKQLSQWVDFLHSKNLIDDTAVTYQKLNTNTNI